MGVSTPDVSWSSASSSFSSVVFQIGMLFKFLINGEALHLTGLCLIWFRVTIFSFGSIPPCSITSVSLMSRWLPLIIPLFRRRWMSCLLREQLNHLLMVLVSILVCLWFLSILVASGPYINLNWFNHYMHVPSFKMPTIRHVWQLIQHGDYAFSIDLQDAYLHIPIVKHHHHFLQFVWHNLPYQLKVLPFGLVTTPLVFTALTKLILFLCHYKGFCIVIYLDDILVLVHSKQAGRRAHSFLCSLLVRLGLHINFSKSDLCLTQTFCFLGLCWDMNCSACVMSFSVTCYMFTILPPIYFLGFIFPFPHYVN